MYLVSIIIYFLIFLYFLIYNTKQILHIFQLNNYKHKNKKISKKYRESLIFFILSLHFIIFSNFFINFIIIFLLLVFFLFKQNKIYFLKKYKKLNKNKSTAKINLKYTNRIKKYFLFNILFFTLINIFFFSLFYFLYIKDFSVLTSFYGIKNYINLSNSYEYFKAQYLFLETNFILLIYSDYFLFLSDFFVSKIESKKAKKYISDTTKFFNNNPTLKKIGITGSVGKTSVKNFLYTLLNFKYKIDEIVATPKNFNTPLGMSLSKKNITEKTKFFIAEMGARNKGDIKELCNIVSPNFGIITNVSDSHIETFKNTKNIFNTKKELADFLDFNNLVIDFDNPYLRELILKNKNIITVSNKTFIHKINSNIITKNNKKKSNINVIFIDKKQSKNENLINNFNSIFLNSPTIYTNNISIKNNYTEFEIIYNKKIFKTKTFLLGKASIKNILLTLGGLLLLNEKLENFVNYIPNLQPVEHRLELIQTNNMYIIDDTYNASEYSVKEAIEVLKLFNKGRKILATCGIVEGGTSQNKINFQLAKSACEFVDIFIIINKTNKDILLLGASESKNKNCKILTFDTLSDAQKQFKTLFKKNDTLLLLNDLPDNYK